MDELIAQTQHLINSGVPAHYITGHIAKMLQPAGCKFCHVCLDIGYTGNMFTCTACKRNFCDNNTCNKSIVCENCYVIYCVECCNNCIVDSTCVTCQSFEVLNELQGLRI